MELDIQTIITVATALISAAGGAGITTWRERKKQAKLNIEKTFADEWKRLYERSDEDSRSKDTKIDKLYEEIAKYRDRDNEQTTQIAVLELKNCAVRGCKSREPKTGY